MDGLLSFDATVSVSPAALGFTGGKINTQMLVAPDGTDCDAAAGMARSM
jgi:hypothetical protein